MVHEIATELVASGYSPREGHADRALSREQSRARRYRGARAPVDLRAAARILPNLSPLACDRSVRAHDRAVRRRRRIASRRVRALAHRARGRAALRDRGISLADSGVQRDARTSDGLAALAQRRMDGHRDRGRAGRRAGRRRRDELAARDGRDRAFPRRSPRARAAAAASRCCSIFSTGASVRRSSGRATCSRRRCWSISFSLASSSSRSGALLVMRSGNDSDISPSQFELELAAAADARFERAAALQGVLVRRAVHDADRRAAAGASARRRLAVGARPGVGIGDVIDTFSHLHTPLADLRDAHRHRRRHRRADRRGRDLALSRGDPPLRAIDCMMPCECCCRDTTGSATLATRRCSRSS